MHARAGNGLRPYPGLRKGMSPRFNENRYNAIARLGEGEQVTFSFIAHCSAPTPLPQQ
jgi:hypothetical protein